MSDVFLILGRAAVYFTTPDTFRGVLLASEVRTEAHARAEVVMLKRASEAAIATVFACRQLTSLGIWECHRLTALSKRLGDCAALTTLKLTHCRLLTAIPERFGDCAALLTLELARGFSLAALPDRLGNCAALVTLYLYKCYSLTALPERLGDCAVPMTLDLYNCCSLTVLPERLGVRGVDVTDANVLLRPHRRCAARAAPRQRGAGNAGSAAVRQPPEPP